MSVLWYTFTMKQKGFSLTETLIVGAVFGLVLVIGTFLLGAERARTRDAKRVADMTRLSGGFAVLYAAKASYIDAATGCAHVNDLANLCTLPSVGVNEAVRDPGQYSYRVARVPDRDDFGISFRLERPYGDLPAGVHTLSKNGIR